MGHPDLSFRTGEGEEGVFQAGGGDFETAQGGVLAEEFGYDTVGVCRGDDDGFAVLIDGEDRGQSADNGGVDVGDAADAASGYSVLDFGWSSLGEDFSLAQDDDAAGEGIGLVKVMGGEQD